METERSEKDKFACYLCKFCMNYQYFGSKPPFAKAILLMEEAYVMKDPFSADGGLVILGSNCSLCQKTVCAGQSCSVFYMRRFCMNCYLANEEEFPQEVQQEVTKHLSKAKD